MGLLDLFKRDDGSEENEPKSEPYQPRRGELIAGDSFESFPTNCYIEKGELVRMTFDGSVKPTSDGKQALGISLYEVEKNELTTVALPVCTVVVEAKSDVSGWVKPASSTEWVSCERHEAFGQAHSEVDSEGLFQMWIAPPSQTQ